MENKTCPKEVWQAKRNKEEVTEREFKHTERISNRMET